VGDHTGCVIVVLQTIIGTVRGVVTPSAFKSESNDVIATVEVEVEMEEGTSHDVFNRQTGQDEEVMFWGGSSVYLRKAMSDKKLLEILHAYKEKKNESLFILIIIVPSVHPSFHIRDNIYGRDLYYSITYHTNCVASSSVNHHITGTRWRVTSIAFLFLLLLFIASGIK